MMVARLLSFWEGNFSGSMLNFRWVHRRSLLIDKLGMLTLKASPNAFWVQVFKRHPQTHRFGKSQTKPSQTWHPGWVVGRSMVFIHLQVRTSFGCMSQFPKRTTLLCIPNSFCFRKTSLFFTNKNSLGSIFVGKITNPKIFVSSFWWQNLWVLMSCYWAKSYDLPVESPENSDHEPWRLNLYDGANGRVDPGGYLEGSSHDLYTWLITHGDRKSP